MGEVIRLGAGKDGSVVSLIFPAYNPGASIVESYARALEFLRSRREPWELIFVCDGCTDGTTERLRCLGEQSRDSRVRLVHYSQNRGKGYALRVGLLAARGAYRIFTDVDLAYSFEEVARVATLLRAGAEVVVADREHPESRVMMPSQSLGYAYRRRLQSRIFAAVVQRMLPLPLHDTQAGLKGMTAAVATSVIPRIACDGFGFDCEFLTACVRFGLPIATMPVTVRLDGPTSTTGFRSTVQMIADLRRIQRRWHAIASESEHVRAEEWPVMQRQVA